jgi:lipid A 3-O-deacylase
MVFRRYLRCKATLAEVIVAFFVLLAAHAYADTSDVQPTNNHVFSESGVFIGCGTGKISEGHYDPVLLIWHLGYDLGKVFNGLNDGQGKLSFYVEPQINPVFHSETNFECGVGFGLKYMHPLTENVSAYLMFSVGPHYISVVTADQANGFLFSDTLGAGISFFLTNKSMVSVEYRFRHMSNADLKSPNVGIENHFGLIGYSILF